MNPPIPAAALGVPGAPSPSLVPLLCTLLTPLATDALLVLRAAVPGMAVMSVGAVMIARRIRPAPRRAFVSIRP